MWYYLLASNFRPTNYTMTDGSVIQACLTQVSQVKDLGLWLANSLTPILQCQKATNKAIQVIGMIRRFFQYLTKQSFLPLYKLLIRPQHKYIVSLSGVLI